MNDLRAISKDLYVKRSEEVGPNLTAGVYSVS
jgi:hypothetical protein